MIAVSCLTFPLTEDGVKKPLKQHNPNIYDINWGGGSKNGKYGKALWMQTRIRLWNLPSSLTAYNKASIINTFWH